MGEARGALWRGEVGGYFTPTKSQERAPEGGVPTPETLLELEEGEDERSGWGSGNHRRCRGEAECVVMETDGRT